MFDATGFPPRRPEPQPLRPAPLDIHALLPLLRVQAAEAALEHLAIAVGANAVALRLWMRDNALTPNGAYADLGPSSPAWQLAAAQEALATACWRYRISTGYDGLALARRVVEQNHGAELAAYALRPLTIAAADCPELDDLIAGDTPEALLPEPEPTVAQRRAAAVAMAEWMLSEPAMGDLGAGLEALLAACEADGGDPQGEATRGAVAAVGEAVGAALRRGCEAACVQSALNWWTAAAGGPTITVRVGDP
jgi:hypothetical protein